MKCPNLNYYLNYSISGEGDMESAPYHFAHPMWQGRP